MADYIIKDNASIFNTPFDVKPPFPVHVITGTNYVDKSTLEYEVHRAVDGPDVLAIGIDPLHRHVVVHFGTGLGVPSSSWAMIARAGNGQFKDQRWTTGVAQIVNQTAMARTHTEIQTPVNPAPDNTGMWVAGGVCALFVIGIVVWWLSRRTQRQTADYTVSDYVPSVTPYRSYSAPVTRSYSAAPVTVIDRGGSNDLLTGYVLGEMSNRHSEPTYQSTYHHSEPTPAPSYDSGGSSSSWSSPSYDPTPSFDSGGSSSSFDSGGGGSDF